MTVPVCDYSWSTTTIVIAVMILLLTTWYSTAFGLELTNAINQRNADKDAGKVVSEKGPIEETPTIMRILAILTLFSMSVTFAVWGQCGRK